MTGVPCVLLDEVKHDPAKARLAAVRPLELGELVHAPLRQRLGERLP